MDKFLEIQMFVAAADAGSLSEAARRLGTTKSAVSERLQQLEKRLGTDLLERSRPVRPTATGLIFYEHSVRILGEVGEAEDSVLQVQSSMRGSLRIAIPMAFGMSHLTALLVKFAVRFPGIDLNVESDDRFVNMHDENFDVAIRLGNLEDSRLVAKTISVNRHLICGSPEYLARRGVPLQPADLRDHDGLMYSNREPHGAWQLPVQGVPQPFRLQPKLCTDSGHHLLEAARAGLGLAILPSFLASGAIAADELQVVLPAHAPSGGFISAIYRTSHRGSPKIQSLVSFLIGQIGTPPVWDQAIKAKLPLLAASP
ncbi:MAG: LysR family transcriptional regulator [Polaromonas sp.]|nr:LysR family transcriptional regulator [Polaromonas sp.]